MPLQYAKDIIDAMSQVGVKQCSLIGGEPTIYPDLTKIISCCRKNNIKTTLVTNGRKLKNKNYLEQLIDAGLSRVSISVEGHIAKVHNAITARNSFGDVVEGIYNCLSADIPLSTVTTINQLNYQHLESVIKFLDELGVKNIGFNCHIPPLGDLMDESNAVLSPQHFAGIVTDLFYKSKQYKTKVYFNFTLPVCLLDSRVLEEMIKNDAIDYGCPMYYSQGVSFDPLGNILPCTYFVDFPLIKNCMNKDKGFVYKDNFLDLLSEDGDINEFRKNLWQYPSIRCINCKNWGQCIGGCPLLWNNFRPSDVLK